jgi:predicted methyltransferase
MRRRSVTARTAESHRSARTLCRPGVADYGARVRSRLVVLVVLGLAGCPHGSDLGGTHHHHHHYDDKQAALAHFEEPARDAWAMPAEVVAKLGIEPEMDVADIGAGSGYFTRRLAIEAPGGITYAIDVDADFKDHIEEELEHWGTPNIVTRLAVYEHPLLPEASVDRVFISNTYSFLQDRISYFSAVHKALRPRGKLAVVDWRADADCPRSTGCPRTKQRVPEAVAREELGRSGFTVVEDFDFLPYQYFLLLARTEDVAAPVPTEPGQPGQPSQPNSTPSTEP